MAFEKKIISFCLWGNNAKYIIGAIRNAELARKIYPGWICRFYVGKSTLDESAKFISQLESFSNVEIVKMDVQGDWRGMFWRFFPASDNDVDIMISRDTDSRLSKREKCAVDEWLRSDKKFHIIRDHPYHHFKILGGMWGARRGAIPDMKKLIDDYGKGDFWQVDQNFLAEVIYPKISHDAFIHDEFGVGKKNPTKRKNFEFIGDVFDEFDQRDPDLWKELKIVKTEKSVIQKKIHNIWKKLKKTY
jgi:protein O-GlcNAc transferase